MTRTWTIRDEGERPLTTNAVMGLHRQAWAKHTRTTRATWWALAVHHKVPRLDAITVDVIPLHKNGRSPQDVAACAPHAKAAVDGLIDARVVPDDDPAHLLAIRFWPPRIDGVDGLELVVTEHEGAATCA